MPLPFSPAKCFLSFETLILCGIESLPTFLVLQILIMAPLVLGVISISGSQMASPLREGNKSYSFFSPELKESLAQQRWMSKWLNEWMSDLRDRDSLWQQKCWNIIMSQEKRKQEWWRTVWNRKWGESQMGKIWDCDYEKLIHDQIKVYGNFIGWERKKACITA